MKYLLSILCLFVLSCDEDAGEDLTYYDLYCNTGYVDLWGDYYDIETTEILDLSDNDMSGIIPSHIGCLENVWDLRLSRNEFSGEIPPEIGDLTNLTTLSLWQNQLTGEIPPEIGNLTNLTNLSLHTNQLTGVIPPEIGNLTNLTNLDLSDNQLTGVIPEEICNIYHLGEGYNQYQIEFYVENNKFCPPYPECISQDDINSQDTSNCP